MGRVGILLLVLLFILPAPAPAAVTGSMDFLHSRSEVTTTSPASPEEALESVRWLQRYRLYFDNRLYPALTLRAGVRIERENMRTETDQDIMESENRRIVPTISLTLANPFLNAGAGYEAREERREAQGSSVTLVRENTTASIGIRPEGLPSAAVSAVHTEQYDLNRTETDRREDTVSMTAQYRPVRQIDLTWQAVRSQGENNISGSETDLETSSGRIAYHSLFFYDRASVSGSYLRGRQESGTSRNSGDQVLLRLFPLAGLSGIDDTPAQGPLGFHPALIDGNLAADSGVNIGALPSRTGDSRKRNVGVDLGIATEVNTLFLWVDRALPAQVVNAFEWEIYVSPDNQNWSLHHIVYPALFGILGDNRFEISFPQVRARYIKAATRPLPAAVAATLEPNAVDVIAITEVQAFREDSVSGQSRSNVIASEAIDLSGRVNISSGEGYSLFYSVYIQDRETRQAGTTFSESRVSNALIGTKQFTRAVGGTGRITREHDSRSGGERLNYTIYDVTVSAVGASLPRLRHNLFTTLRHEDRGGVDSDSGSLFLTNEAEFYPGIDGVLSGGGSMHRSAAGVTSENSSLTAGAAIVPHRAVTINLNYDRNRTRQTGPGGGSTTAAESKGAAATYNPFSNLYLYGTFSIVHDNGETRRIRNFSVSWSESQRNGALQVTLTYNESISPDNRSRSRVAGPAVRWRVNRATSVDFSYYKTESEAADSVTEAKTINSGLRLRF